MLAAVREGAEHVRSVAHQPLAPLADFDLDRLRRTTTTDADWRCRRPPAAQTVPPKQDKKCSRRPPESLDVGVSKKVTLEQSEEALPCGAERSAADRSLGIVWPTVRPRSMRSSSVSRCDAFASTTYDPKWRWRIARKQHLVVDSSYVYGVRAGTIYRFPR
jgi:hypothetical protein